LTLEYTRDLGYCAAKFLFSGGNAAMVSLQAGNFVPIPLPRCSIPARVVRDYAWWTALHPLRIARRYMIRLRRDDFDDPAVLTKFGGVCNPKLVG